MSTFVLILFFHVGMLGKTDSNASTTVPGFTSQATCAAAGEEAKKLVKGTVKEMSFVCVALK